MRYFENRGKKEIGLPGTKEGRGIRFVRRLLGLVPPQNPMHYVKMSLKADFTIYSPVYE